MPDATQLSKMDRAMREAVRAYESLGPSPDHADGLSVRLQFEGDIAAIEALGFETHRVSGQSALGVVRFKDAPALAAHAGVKWMAAGSERTADVDVAVPDIRVRASTTGTVGTSGSADGLWHVDGTSGVMTAAVSDATGAGVIVAIIDSGIDYTHPMFMKQITPTKQTRIRRIWDQGLVPAALTDCPPVAHLVSLDTYGVEFDAAEIDAALLSGTALGHRDCNGHGTHVAGIAAGGPKVAEVPHGHATNVGVAPDADIIAVKYLDNPLPIRFMTATGLGANVLAGRLLDAVVYCLRTARNLPASEGGPKPIVVNISLGSIAEPGDGLDEDAQDVDRLMDPTQPDDGVDHFSRGAIIVKSSGNDGGNAGSGHPPENQTARITVPLGGEIIVPFELKDSRGSVGTKWKECGQNPHSPTVSVHLWYRRAAAPLSVQFAVQPPHDTGFGADVSVAGSNEVGFNHITTPTVRDVIAVASSSVHRLGIEHFDDPAVPHPAGGTVHRHHVQLFVKPKVIGTTVSYDPGIYELRIRAPADTVVWAMCQRESWGPTLNVTWELASTMRDGTTAPHANIVLTNESSSTDPFGQHVITVASYRDTDHHIAASSSRGPLRDFSDPAAPLALIALKPDIAGPGVGIMSAMARDTNPIIHPAVLPAGWTDGVRFRPLSGTSMAAPMVAGVIALMLDKKNDLNITEVRTHLTGSVRAAVNPPAAPLSTQAYGSGMVDGLPTHAATP